MGGQDMTQPGARRTKKPITTRTHDSVYDGRWRQITPLEVEKATRVVKQFAGKDAPAILTMLGLGS